MSFEINGFTIFIIFCVCINALASYPVQILCAFDIMEQATWFKTGTTRAKTIKRVSMRSLIILFVTGLALIIPNFTDFLNIAGSLGAGMVAFILPPWLYNLEFKETVSRWRFWFNWFVVVFGVVGSILSIVASIKSIIDSKK